jgi:hypothetical protein
MSPSLAANPAAGTPDLAAVGLDLQVTSISLSGGAWSASPHLTHRLLLPLLAPGRGRASRGEPRAGEPAVRGPAQVAGPAAPNHAVDGGAGTRGDRPVQSRAPRGPPALRRSARSRPPQGFGRGLPRPNPAALPSAAVPWSASPAHRRGGRRCPGHPSSRAPISSQRNRLSPADRAAESFPSAPFRNRTRSPGAAPPPALARRCPGDSGAKRAHSHVLLTDDQ